MGKNLSRVSRCVISLGLLGLLLSVMASGLVKAQDKRERVVCPSDIERLGNLMVNELPHYANRVIQRAKRRGRSETLYNYVLVAGKPEFKPLPLRQFSSQDKPISTNETEQIFFTTLERQYSRDRVTKTQNYHWLFLTKTEQGWTLVMVFSQLAAIQPGGTPLPTRDTTNGIIGQAVRLWLRDCEAGAIKITETIK